MQLWRLLFGDVLDARDQLADGVLEHLQTLIEEEKAQKLADASATTQGA